MLVILVLVCFVLILIQPLILLLMLMLLHFYLIQKWIQQVQFYLPYFYPLLFILLPMIFSVNYCNQLYSAGKYWSLGCPDDIPLQHPEDARWGCPQDVRWRHPWDGQIWCLGEVPVLRDVPRTSLVRPSEDVLGTFTLPNCPKTELV